MKNYARTTLAGIWGILCLTAFSAPMLLANSFPAAAVFCYFPFSHFCHQNPDRSFFIMQYPMALCHRCSGIYLGLFLGTILARILHRTLLTKNLPYIRQAQVLVAVTPLALDALLPFIGLWNGTSLSRFLTGIVFGCLIAPILVEALEELIQLYFRRVRAIFPPSIEGDLS